MFTKQSITLVNNGASAMSLFQSIQKNAGKIMPVFDLDGVVFDATHRQICNPDGSLNLAKYREMSTAEHIAKDALLPLALVPQLLTMNQIPFAVCTARVACEHTRDLMFNNGINPYRIFAREGETDTRRDYQLKRDHLTNAYDSATLSKSFLIDDNKANIEMALDIGMRAIYVPFEGH